MDSNFIKVLAQSYTTVAKELGKFKEGYSNIVNSGNYSSNDVIFVSIGGKRPANNLELRKSQQDRTIKEAIKAIEAGATLITDNVNYIHYNSITKQQRPITMSIEEFRKENGLYNEGEKRLYENLKAKGYIYSEQTVDGQVLGVWSKKTNSTQQAIRDVYENSLKDKGNSSKTKLNNIKVSAKGKMTYSYGQYQGDIKSETTLEAIKNGERTATTRYEADGHLEYWKNLKVGDIVEWEGKNGEKVLVEITKPLQKLTEKNLNGNAWCKLEGWSLDYYLEKVLPKIDTAWQMEYKLVDTQKANNSIPTNTSLFTTKINQFTYSYNPTTQEVIHNAKTGDKVETNQTQINKVLVAYAKENNFPIQNFNKQDYVYINGKVLNSNTGAEVTNPKILTLFNAPIPVTSFSEFSSNVSLTDEDIE